MLYLVRHGIAVPSGTPGIPDSERPLTAKGERHLKRIARGLRRLDVQPERIVTSPLPRAYRTAEIVAAGLGLESRLERAEVLSATSPAEAIWQWLQTREESSLMIVGHNPAFSRLVGLIVTGENLMPVCELSKGGVAAFRPGEAGGVVIDWIAPPGLLRKLGRKRGGQKSGAGSKKES
jgi:phosphohistidine phosphatase